MISKLEPPSRPTLHTGRDFLPLYGPSLAMLIWLLDLNGACISYLSSLHARYHRVRIISHRRAPLCRRGRWVGRRKRGWAYNTSWAYNTYSTVLTLYLESDSVLSVCRHHTVRKAPGWVVLQTGRYQGGPSDGLVSIVSRLFSFPSPAHWASH